MNISNNKSSMLLKLSLLFYLLILLIFFLVSFFPEGRVWGVSFWGYFPKYIPILLILVGIMAPVGLWLSRKSKANNAPDIKSEDSNTTYFIIAGVIVVTAGLLFYFFRATNHFLGDGYQNLARLIENPLVKPREIGETLVHIWVKSLFSGKEGEVSALLSYQVISIGAGVIFLIVTALTAARLFKPTIERMLYFLGVISGGYVLLFFGYVENYSMFVLSVGVFCQVGLLIACRKLSRWWALPITALAVFFHILGVTLLPALVYLIISGSKLGDILSRLNNKLKIICSLVVLTALFVIFYHYYSNNLYFKFAFIPPLATRFTVEGYTLFSWKHIADYLNLWMVLLPSFAIFVLLLFFVPLSSLIKKREYRFLIALFLSTAGAVFIFDPKIGMPRDWDLFSFADVPAVILGYYALLNNREHIKYALMLAVVTILLGWLQLAPRVAVINLDYIAVEHLKNYLDLDYRKNRNAWFLLVNYYNDKKDQENFEKAQKVRETGFAERTLLLKAEALKDEGKCLEAVPIYHQSLAVNPIYPDAWWQLGECYNSLQLYDSAVYAFSISDGLNPYNTTTLNNLGVAYMYKGQLKKAEKILLKSLSIDSTASGALTNLVMLYRLTQEIDKMGKYLIRLTTYHDVSSEFMQGLGEYYLYKMEYEKAAEALKKALDEGMDTTRFKILLGRHPPLRQFFISR